VSVGDGLPTLRMTVPKNVLEDNMTGTTKANRIKTNVNWDEDRNEVELTKEEIGSIHDMIFNNPAPIEKIFNVSREEMYADEIYKAKCRKWYAENGIDPITHRSINEDKDDELFFL